MDSNRIKQVALGARTTLMQEVDAALDRVLAPDSAERVARSQAVFTIERTVADRGREAVVEQVAYTWFNRLCALRYMDVRGYTPVGLVSPRAGETLPAVLADARRGVYSAALGITQRDKDAINAMLNGETSERDPLGRAYVMLLVAACKAYEKSMDYLFGAGRDLGPAIELLAPTDLLSEGSLLQRICKGLDEATCNEGVEVMGWLYQFYISEKHDEFNDSSRKAEACDIAPATQFFTPNWIVRFLVENSLGRLWMLNFPDSELVEHMDYYIVPEESEEDFLRIYSPEDITFLDPACGSGHILVYAFDLLYLMYEEEGYRPSDIPELILKNNLTGIEIDDRAAEIASFCLEMKALEKDEYFLARDVDANIVVTHRFDISDEERLLVANLSTETNLMTAARHLDELGSLYIPAESDLLAIKDAMHNIENDTSINGSNLRSKLERLYGAISVLSSCHSVVVTNPPYLTSGKMNAWLSDWVKNEYPDEKGDLCTCFISRCFRFSLANGYPALITMQSWMFLASYEHLRTHILRHKDIAAMAHFGAHAFDAIGGEVVKTTATVFINRHLDLSASYIRLVDYPSEFEKNNHLLEAIGNHNCGFRYSTKTSDFKAIDGNPVSYWGSDKTLSLFRNDPISRFFETREGMSTADNARFLRLWQEVSFSNIGFGMRKGMSTQNVSAKWYPYQKGGTFRRWSGNNEYVVNWENDGYEILNNRDRRTGRIRSHNYNGDYAFRMGVSWSTISGELHVRLVPEGFLFDSTGAMGFCDSNNELLWTLGFLNTPVAVNLLALVMGEALHFKFASILRLPGIETDNETIRRLVADAVDLAECDWNLSEISWDFTWHPLVPSHHEWLAQHNAGIDAKTHHAIAGLIEERFKLWETDCKYRFDQLKSNEEELNRIFARIYGMEGEVSIGVPDDKVSVRLADLNRDIKSLVSYGVGCMFGRYSLDEPGFILADEGSTLDDYHAKVPNPTFEPDRTGVIPITPEDVEWFEDDIVAQFRRWLAAAYGQDMLDENVVFIEQALGKSLRAYFVRDFYDDHLKTYQKRPIYWLFQSPKKGLSALVYLHRYNPNTVTTLLTEYVRPLREQMDAQARLLEVTGNARDASTATKYRATIEELDEWEHDVIFPLSQKHVTLDLDDGVKANYGKAEFKGALRKVTGLN